MYTGMVVASADQSDSTTQHSAVGLSFQQDGGPNLKVQHQITSTHN
jgi:hypothetical protein